jgi:hypothetical protein
LAGVAGDVAVPAAQDGGGVADPGEHGSLGQGRRPQGRARCPLYTQRLSFSLPFCQRPEPRKPAA